LLENKGGFNVAMDTKKIIKEYFSAINAHDVNKIVSFWADDDIREDVPQGIVSTGKNEVAAFYTAMFVNFPDFKGELKSVFGAGDWAVVEYVMSGIQVNSKRFGKPTNGNPYSFRGAEIFQVNNGKIIKQSDYYNMMTILQQLGLMPGQAK
jgi:steroid delta-isomerase-like uncharacterized protein